MSRRRLLTPAALLSLAISSGAVVAQDASPAASPDPGGSPPASSPSMASPVVPTGETVTVIARDHVFEGLPSSVPVGTALELRNEGRDLHELIVVRRNDGVTESWDELLGLSDEEVFEKVTFVGQVFAAPGQTATDLIVVDQEGDHFAVCFVPEGMTEIPEFAESSPGTEASPGTQVSPGPSIAAPASPTASEGPFGLPHVMLGMRQEFVVTGPGTTPGPMPSPAVTASPQPGASPDAAGSGQGSASPMASPAA